MSTLVGLKRDGEAITLSWQDGTSAKLMPRVFRLECPCAHCVSEVTGRRLLDPASVADDLGLVDMQPVGNYAYRMLFSDGHDSGIFRLELLHQLSQTETAGESD
jgi:ATP-binding protein involved in chromosome partitioning